MVVNTEEINEAELMRTCGHLYTAIALESFATTLLGVCFTYLLLLITNKGRLQKPGKAAISFISTNLKVFACGVIEEVKQWPQMNKLPLERRFALCRKTNQTICLFQILIAILTIERWLHINNVNGFRYLGYSMTCPPMQTELLILIAPVVPCYKLNCVFTYIITILMLWFGYAASVIEGQLYEGDLSLYMQTQDRNDLRLNVKFYFMAIACVIQFYLSFVQIPLLLLLYCCKGGEKAGLPHGYIKLLLIVGVSWLSFPIWWALSYEGMSVITDTKANAAGFALLNVISKGSFTLQMLSMAKWHRNENKRQQAIKEGRRPSLESEEGIFDASQQLEQADRTVDKKDTWIVQILRPYDNIRGSSRWASLDHSFRMFLASQNVSPSKWSHFEPNQKSEVQEAFEKTISLVTRSASEAVEKRESSKTKVKELEQENSGSTDIVEEPVFKPGQWLSCIQGVKGRVIEATGCDIKLEVPGDAVHAIRTGDVTSAEVQILSAWGLEDMDQGMSLHWSCLVDGLPDSEVQTPAKPVSGNTVVWQHTAELFGFGPGDLIVLRLWAISADAEVDYQVGEAKLSCSSMVCGKFKGDLQLCKDGRIAEACVSIDVNTVNLPGLPKGLETL